jgi:hypothetical protein
LASNLVQQLRNGLAHLANRMIECGLIGARWLAESAHLTDELERGRGDFIARGRVRAAQDFDASAHTCHHMK